MTIRALCCCVLLALVAGCGGTKTVTVTRTVTVDSTAKESVGPPGETALFGYIKSLTKKGSSYELRFDPALFLGGETANVAAAEDGAVEPGEPVPNDHYVVDEGHRLLTYRVPADAKADGGRRRPEEHPGHGRGAGDGSSPASKQRPGFRSRAASGCAPASTPSSRSTSSTGPRRGRGIVPALELPPPDPVRRSLDHRDRLVLATRATRR